MDSMLVGLVLILFTLFIPALLATLTLKAYLSIVILAILLLLSYLWLIEKIAPPESQSRKDSILGLSRVYPPEESSISSAEIPGSDTRTAVIFIHGLGANPNTTWRSGGICWITDFLPDDFKDLGRQSRVRLFLFNYKSFWLRRSRLRLSETANALRQELKSDEILGDDIILVGHSYGGLVIKKALAMSPELKQRLKGIIFLGTPHQGTSASRYGRLVSYIFAPLGSDIDIMRVLEPGSEDLYDLQTDFHNHFRDVTRKYFFEKEKTYHQLWGFITWVDEFVATKLSATWGADGLDAIGLDADHRGMNKFSGRDNNYRLVSREILAMLRRKSVIPYTRSPWQTELREFLKGNHHNDEYNPPYVNIQPCDWLYKLERYTTWAGGEQTAILWLTGPPGCGKSVLFNQILRQPPKTRVTQRQYVLEFVCNSQHETLATTPMNIASAMLWQLTELLPRLVDEAQPESRPEDRVSKLTRKYLLEDLCGLLLRTLRKLAESDAVLVAIDALDECRFCSGVDPFLRFLEDLPSHDAQRQLSLKLLLSARSHTFDDIIQGHPQLVSREAQGRDASVIHVPDENSAAVRSYVEQQLKAWAGENIKKRDLRPDLEETIIRQSEGIFLWTTLVVEGLFQRGSSPAEWEQALQTLPPGNDLFQLLRHIIERIPAVVIDKTRSMIILAITSTRFLSTSEFAALLGIQKSQKSQDVVRNTPTEIERDVLTLCRSLLTCSRGFVGPFHLIVRDFFHHESCPKKFRIGHEDAHGILANACLKCLQFMRIPHEGGTEAADPLQYGADNLLYHTMQTSEAKQMELANPIRQFFRSKDDFTSWLRFVWDTGELLRQDLVLFQLKSTIFTGGFQLQMPRNVTPMHVLALVIKSKKLFSAIVFRGEVGEGVWRDLNQTDSDGRSVLHWAAGQQAETVTQKDDAAKEEEIISDLIARGLNADARANNGRSPMHIVAQHGRRENLIALLKHGADYRAKDKVELTPLHLSALYPGSIERLSDLIKIGAEIDAREEGQWTPLHLAAQNGHTEAIKALVDAGASVGATGEHKVTPLHLAAQNGYTEAIEALVAGRASVGALTGKGTSPLHLAAQNGHTEAIRALVTGGASVDARGKDQMTPLHLAAKNGHTEAIKALVDAGASVDDRENKQWTPLHLAAHNGHTGAIRALVAAGASADDREEDQWTPLHLAAHNGHTEAIRALVTGGASVNIQGGYQWTPLHFAAQNGHTEAIRALVTGGASVDARGKDQMTPLHLAAKNGHTDAIKALVAAGASVDDRDGDEWMPLHFAAQDGHTEAVEALLAAGVSVGALTGRGNSPLHLAAQNGHTEAIRALVTGGASVDARGKDQMTPLHLAAKNGHTEAIKALVDAGASVDDRDEDQWTPLHFAAQNGHTEAIKALIDAGASVDDRENKQWTPLHLAAHNGHTGAIKALVAAGASADDREEDQWTPLHLAAQNGHTDAIKALVAAGASVDDRDGDEWMPLHFAAQDGHTEAVEALVAAGVSVGALTGRGNSPLHLAAQNGHTEAIRALVTGGASVDARGKDQMTPLHLAAKNGHTEAIKALVDAGASVDDRDEDQWTPLHFAAQNGHTDAIKALVAAGASVDDRENKQWTPLHFAAKNGNEKVVIALLNQDSLDPDRKDHYGLTPLSIAVRNCHTVVVKALLATGKVAVDSQDSFGRTALWWARRVGSAEMEQLLLDYAWKKGTPVYREGGPIEVRSVSNDGASRWCDVCSLSIPGDEAYYECEVCNGGDLDICLECYKIGGRCLRNDHQLVCKVDKESLD